MHTDSVCKMTISPTASANPDEMPHASSRLPVEVAAGTGLLGMAGLMAVYFGLLTLVSGWPFARDQFDQFGPYIIALAGGFGIQVGLFTYLHRAVHEVHSGKVVAVSGATSGAAMVSCCTHYLVNLLPALGATGLVSLVSQYQIELFWVGLAANLAGILYIARRLVLLRAGSVKTGTVVSLLLSVFIALAAIALPASARAQTAQLTVQENKAGQVTVKVTPLDLSAAAKAWQFKLVFDTHSASLDQDLLAVALLSDSSGTEYKPSAWDGNPPGGHHREGILSFKPLLPVPPSVTLKVRAVGGITERQFTWRLGTP